jgi:hypothetical protein
MPKNMGPVDRVLRVVVALAIAALIITKVLTGTPALVLGVLAVVFLLTAILRFCPLYCPLKISTAKKSKS